MIQYMGTIFLALFMVAFILDKIVFTTSTELYRNFSYDDNSRHDVNLMDVGMDRMERIDRM